MKVAVYSISKNEEQFVERWAESAKDADMILLADTGSTDNTVELAKSLGVSVVEIEVKPWRFDVARNKSLDAIPQNYDYCIALDLDEVLVSGWRKHLELMHHLGVTRPRYKYTWSWNADGSEGLVYGGDKIHARKFYTWKHPVHEVLKCTNKKEKAVWCDVEIHHHPDNSKPRSQYLPLLKLSVEEDPHDDRNAHYYARELLMYGYKDEALAEFKRHLALPNATWKPERAASYRYMSQCVTDADQIESYLFKCIAEYPEAREGWVALSRHFYVNQDWHGCYFAAKKALNIVEKPLLYFNEPWAWDSYIYDIASIAAYHLKQDDDAIEWCEKALEFEPDNEHLINNLVQFKEGRDG
jgi:glycosyltransferase involved in cell wall biosynthesis